nr:non-ribosomal peptide synthetase [Iningainema tapete]
MLDLSHLDIKLWVEQGRLRCSAPKGTLTPEIRTQLSERKVEIINFLNSVNLNSYSKFESIRPVPRDKDLPLSFAQQRLWFLYHLDNNSNNYHINFGWQITGNLNVVALEQAIRNIVFRHEVLRTSFELVNGNTVHKVHPEVTIFLPVVNLENFPEAEQSKVVQDLATQEAEKPFDLSKPPLLRVTLLRLSEASHVLLFTWHHIVFDGWSRGVFTQELSNFYQAFLSGITSYPPLPIQYADFAVWQRQYLQGEVLESLVTYWKQQIGGELPLLELPTDRLRPPVQTYRGAKQTLKFSLDLSKKIKTLTQQEGVTLFITLLAAFKVLLYRYSGQEDLIVGSAIANRNRIEIEGLIGFFVNTLVLRTDLSGNPSFRELLQRVREVALQAYTHQDLPFEKLVEELKPQRSGSHTPLFSVMFTWENAPMGKLVLPGLTMTPIELENVTAKFDLTLSMQETAAGLTGELIYNCDLFDAATITRMVANFQTLLEGIVANPNQCICDLPVFSVAQQHQLHIHQQFSCFVIGSGTLVIQCAQMLLERGHQIFGIISSDTLISDWAKGKGIPHIQPTDNLIAFLSQKSFDYLFSIVNINLLPQEILELPSLYAINYHNAPLPKYAGIHSPSWALMHQQKTHGVTWHVMSSLVDAGDILASAVFGIADDETAFTLNGKCYEAAINSFAQLIDELSCHQAIARKQNLGERTYFSRSQRPSTGGVFSFTGGVFSFNRCAREIDALVRALDFGPYPNSLALAKLAIGSDFIVVSKLEVLQDLSKSPTGTVTAIEDNLLKVSTTSYEIALRQVQTIDGQTLSIPDLVAKFGLQVGYRFKDIEPDIARRIEAFDALIAKHEAFWVKKLAMLEPYTIPYAQSKASHSKQKQYAQVKLPVSQEVLTFLERHWAYSLSDFLLATFAAYLARSSGSYCFDIGFKDVSLQHELVGLENFFAEHVPFRVEIGEKQSFAEVFAVLREQVKLTKLHLTFARDTVARYPVLLSVADLVSENKFPVIIERVESIDDYKTSRGNELTLVIPEDGKECCWLYDTEALDGDSIAVMLRSFTTFLQGIVTDITQPIAYLPLLSEEERHLILVEWNNQKVDYPKDCIHQLFEAQAERTPDLIAVVFQDEQLTYLELNQRANCLAHYLQKQGVTSDVLVGIYMERSWEMVVAILGILKAGGAYVPLDPAYPKERLGFMLSDAQVPVLLTQKNLVVGLPNQKANIVCLDADWEVISQENQENPIINVTAKNLAYVIYTSGSTGVPKGVMIPHGALTNYTQAAAAEYNLNTSDRLLQFASISFDAAAEEIFPCLVRGGTLVLRTDAMLSSIHAFLEKCCELKLTVLNLPTAFWHQITSALARENCVLPKQLRLVIIGGEKALKMPLETWHKYVPPRVRLVNTYGPTETTIVATKCDLSEPVWGEVPIGCAIPNVQTYILDKHLQPVPFGVVGELYIGGAGLAWGYLNRPELTAEKFIPHPYSQEADARLYKTGDLARYLSNGQIEFVGRIDHQVKVRGFRIELGEIEAVLSQHPDVLQTVVVAREDVIGDKQLVAYIVVTKQNPPNLSELRSFLQQKLPEYMIPVAFVFMDTIPLTPNGKVDSRALPAPDTSSVCRSSSLTEPRNPTEEVLAAIWAQVLGVEKIGIHDNFFELGGHSLLGMQLISQASLAIGVEIPLKLLFEKQTIALLAQAIEVLANSQQPLKTRAKISGLQRKNYQPENLPLSANQQWSWFNDHPYTTTIKFTYYIVGFLNVAALEQSLNEIVRRHDILRTNFPIVDGKPVQVIASMLTLTVQVIDLRELSGTQKAHKCAQLFEEESLRPFDLNCGSLIRTQLLQVGQQEYLLNFFINHIIFDGFSLGVFMGELSVLYNTFDKGLPSGLAELPFQYADFVHWQQQYMSGEVRQSYDSYWKKKLASAQPIFEPSRELGKLLPAIAHPIELPTNLINSLRKMGRKENVSLFTIMLTAFKLLLHTYTGKDDIVVAVLNANRNPYETKFLIGVFANRLLLRTNLSGNPSFRELLVRVGDMYFESYDYQNLPGIQSGIPTIDHAQVFFNFIPIPRNVKYPPIEKTKLVNFGGGATVTEQDLRLTIFDEEDRVHGRLSYTNRLFDAKTIEHLVNLYRQILEQAVEF